jgi:hypothetical protein
MRSTWGALTAQPAWRRDGKVMVGDPDWGRKRNKAWVARREDPGWWISGGHGIGLEGSLTIYVQICAVREYAAIP